MFIVWSLCVVLCMGDMKPSDFHSENLSIVYNEKEDTLGMFYFLSFICYTWMAIFSVFQTNVLPEVAVGIAELVDFSQILELRTKARDMMDLVNTLCIFHD